MCSTPLLLYLVVQLVDVICQRYQMKFCLNIFLPSHQKPSEGHILLQHTKCSFYLYGSIYSEPDAFFGLYSFLHLAPLPLKGFGHVHIFAALFQRLLAAAFDAFRFMGTASTLGTAIYGRGFDVS